MEDERWGQSFLRICVSRLSSDYPSLVETQEQYSNTGTFRYNCNCSKKFLLCFGEIPTLLWRATKRKHKHTPNHERMLLRVLRHPVPGRLLRRVVLLPLPLVLRPAPNLRGEL